MKGVLLGRTGRSPVEELTRWVAGAVDGARQCSECKEKCPYQPPIREMLVENIAFCEEILRARELHQPGRKSW